MCHPIDVHVGKRIRHRRWQVGMTQQQLAECVGIKFQQIQKYECAINRVSASRLWDIAEAQSVHVSNYFLGMNEGEIGVRSLVTEVPEDQFDEKEALQLVRLYYAIPENQRRKFFELARALEEET
jgi:transcriptional regulator with XRE-family HTH domain